MALRDAGIAAQNLVAVSSILPPGCELVTREEGENSLQPGQILHVVLSREQSREPHRVVGASIGIARPTDPDLHGFIAEHGGYGRTVEEIAAHAEDLAVTMLASTLGIEFDEDLDAAARARSLVESGQLAHADAISAVARGDSGGRWTVCVAAAVFIMEWMLPERR
jgi:arginine decarboxylase